MMDPRIGQDGGDDEVTRALCEMYAPPNDVRFWDALETRVLARIEAEDAEAWWLPYEGWVRRGLIAAALVAVAAGLALGRARNTEARMAYETIIETPRTLPQQLATKTADLPDREATLQYLIEP
jgi:hypothetical protein